ncbi:MAG: anthranilate phosphoribosyltransferase [Candidatus Hadarchaeales archaeon]
MNALQRCLEKVLHSSHLTEEEAVEAMRCLMSGEAPPAQVAAFLTALRMKGETVEELSAFARTMREFSLKVRPKVDGRLVDTCGTGGDRIKTFNISTVAMFVVAGAGVPVAKHGNRSVTSRAGSADVLEALGAVIDLPPYEVERCLERVGVGFMFAPVFHPAMKHVAQVRREMGIRTVFNVLGPLTNPAGARAQLLGVFEPGLTEKLALVLRELGCERAMVVHGLDGLDEFSTLGETQVSELLEGEVRTFRVRPEELGLERARPGDLEGGGPVENARILLGVLGGERGPRRDIVLLNASAALVVGGRISDLREGLQLGSEVLDSGRALEKLREFVKATGGDLGRMEELEGRK